MNHLINYALVLALLFFACKDDNGIPPSEVTYEAEMVVDGLTIPWGMAFLPDGSMLITEQEGKLIHFKDGQKTEISGVPELYYKNQGGLLDIELHPNYSNNGWIYFSYSADTEKDGLGGNTVIMRAKLNGNQLVDQDILYKATPNTKTGNHFGSRLEFDRNGHLFFSIGDRRNRDVNPQDITRDGGKVYRINDDGSIPSDNPFVSEPSAKKAVYSYGHRNPQGMAMHPSTGEIWTHEHGPKGGDEINIIAPGKNYGWPKITFGTNYDGSTITNDTALPGMEQPLHYWVPSIAPSGMAFVTSNKYPNLKGHLLVGSLSFKYLNLCYLEGNRVVKEERLLDGIGRVRNVRQAPDGYIYVAVESKGILKLVPNS